MPNSSQQVHPQAEARTPSPEVALSTRTSPSKLVKVSSTVDMPVFQKFSSCDRDITQVARQFELDKHTAEAEVRALRRKLADITNQEEEDDLEAPPSKRNRTNEDDQDDNDEESQVINAGHRFVILYSPWLRDGEGTFKVECNPELNGAERFESAENKIQGEVQEIKTVLGAKLFGEMSSEPWIARAVS